MLMLLLPREIETDFTRHIVQGMGFNLMEDLRRVSVGRNQIIPASCHVAVRADFQDARSQGIAAAEVIQQPTVKFRVAEGLLDL